ncbi:MAG: hypothetical protein QM784_27280 [Polyangiaceae bacterium]
MTLNAVVLLLFSSAAISSCLRPNAAEPKAKNAETRIRTDSVCAPHQQIPIQDPTDVTPEPGKPLTFSKEAAPHPDETSATSKGVTPEAEKTSAISKDIAPKQEEELHVRVTHFDCTSALEHKRGLSLRSWDSGGPNGAAWNVYDAALICTVTLDAPCVGRARFRLFGNSRELAKRTSPLTYGVNELEVRLPFPEWARAALNDGTPYDTLLLSLGGVVHCDTDPSEQYPFADAFLAGFAGGE